MYVTHYLIKNLDTQQVTRAQFSRQDAVLARVPYAPLGGLPQLEALLLMNDWNTDQDIQRFVFALDTPSGK